MIFQDPMTSLNPVLTVGFQLGEAIKAHYPKESDDTVKARVIELLGLVGVPNPDQRATTSIRTSSPAACGSAR